MFTLTADAIGTWATASDVLTANAGGYVAGAHIFVTSSPADQSNGALTTGYAVNGGPCIGGPGCGGITSEAPIPAALPLFVSGLAGLGVIGWRKRRKAA